MSSEARDCQNCKQQFTVTADDFSFYEKMGVPAPNLCPDCRFRRRAVFRNERTLYKRTCALCQRSIVTMYHPKSAYTVYCNDCWLSDKWDPYRYGLAYDEKRPFFDQLAELTKQVPKAATYSTPDSGPNVNSEYTNFAGGNKDCYLIFNAGPENENCAYSRGLRQCKDTFDTYYANNVEQVYEGLNIQKSSRIFYGQNTAGSLDSWFLLNCSGVQNCFGCVNLRHKSYHFLNQTLSKEEWENKVKNIVGSYRQLEKFKEEFKVFSLKFPRKENNNLKSVNVFGDYIFESKNCFSCFEASFCEDTKYGFSIKLSKDCYDLVGYGQHSELLLDVVGVGFSSRVVGTWWAGHCHDVEYSLAVERSEYCFGCDGLKNAKYCILNKQYSEEEYKKLRAKIIEELKSKGEYGLFFPPSLAISAYNETIGQDNLPLTKEEVLAQGFRWEDDIPRTRGQETLKPEQIPDHIKDVPDSILNEILKCVSCGYNYRLIKPELDFYRRMLVPVPRYCWNCRFVDRIRHRGPFKLYSRQCTKCSKPIQTTYAPERPEIVYCESCYQKEVI